MMIIFMETEKKKIYIYLEGWIFGHLMGIVFVFSSEVCLHIIIFSMLDNLHFKAPVYNMLIYING